MVLGLSIQEQNVERMVPATDEMLDQAEALAS